MDAKRWQKIKGLFDAAVELDEKNRAKFLAEACGGDNELRAEIEKMLDTFEDSGSFMEEPAALAVADLILDSNAKLSAGQTIGHYEIVKQIGVGGMGEVYLAKDNKLGRNVAIKILNEEYSPHDSNLERFSREAKAASALNHPNILVIYEIGEFDQINYIVSEFIKGKTLRDVIKGSPMKTSEVLDIAIQIAGALSAAHGERIIHRDIKPENIMIRPDGYVKVLDFGLAKLIENEKASFDLEDATKKPNQTAKGVVMGTVNYMSPEQAKAEKVDERTDIFSLGVLIYEMITGRTPFDGNSLTETLANLINKDPQPLSRYASHVPGELQRIAAKTLRKNPDERYQTMKGLLADLKELKESLAFDEKLERLRPSGENETAMLQPTTAEADKQTAATGNRFSQAIKKRSPLVIVALGTLLVVGLGFAYWYFGNRTATPQIRSLAVLPLRSLDAGENYLGLGIADTVIRRISQTGEMIVRPTSAVRRYLNEDTDALTAAKQLNTDAVLEGSVQKSDDRLRVSINLLRASDGISLLSDSFDMKTGDIFTIEDKVAQEVASRLQLRLDPAQQARLTKRSTSNPVAWELYLKAVYAFDQRVLRGKDQLGATIDFLKQAIEADPNFAQAHAQLAYAYATNATFFEPTEAVWAERAKEEINQAESLDAQLAETHLARFMLMYGASQGYQGEAAVREVLLAQQLNPNVGHGELAYLYLHLGLEDLAARELQRSSEIDPTSDFAKAMTLLMYEVGCKYDEYATHRELYHDDEMEVIYFMGKGRLVEAQQAIEEWSAKQPDEIHLPPKKALLSALKGDFGAAEALIPVILSRHPVKDPFYHHAAYDIARIYALEGKSDEAVKWLREAAVTGWQTYPLFLRDAYLNRIRQSPEFIQFLADMKVQNDKYKRAFGETP